ERASPQPALGPRFGAVCATAHASPASAPQMPIRPENPCWVGLGVQPTEAGIASMASIATATARAGISDRSAKLRHEPRNDARKIREAEGLLLHDSEQLQEHDVELVVGH